VYSAVSPGFTVCELGLTDKEMLASLPESSAETGEDIAGTSENNIKETSKMLVMFLVRSGSFLRGSMNPGRSLHMKSLCKDVYSYDMIKIIHSVPKL